MLQNIKKSAFCNKGIFQANLETKPWKRLLLNKTGFCSFVIGQNEEGETTKKTRKIMARWTIYESRGIRGILFPNAASPTRPYKPAWPGTQEASGSKGTWSYWIQSDEGNPIKIIRFKIRPSTADLIGFLLFDFIQSNHPSPEPLVPRATGRAALGTRINKGNYRHNQWIIRQVSLWTSKESIWS